MADFILSPIASKTCTKCGVERTLDRFRFANGAYRNGCKDCDNAKQRAMPDEFKAKKAAQKRALYIKEAPEKKVARFAQVKTYSNQNKEKIKEYKKLYCEKNKAEISQKNKERYQLTFEESRLRSKKWRLNNQERKNAANKAWAAANPEKQRESALKSKRRRRENPLVRVHESLSAQMCKSLKSLKAGRKWESLVGYSVQDLIAHLEKQFRGSIGWHNYGEWQIDHITPVASFGNALPGSEGFAHCWSLANLRPLMASENASKRDKITHLI